MKIPKKNIKVFIKKLSIKYNISNQKTISDKLADTFAELSDIKVEEDETLNLILNLYRKKILTKKEMLNCSYLYISEK
tara:strand:- start:5205 stop:5438 length:234 start_codon:yes stop_codon:yes gene_type:complete